mgnify:CR=1 FL=1
MAWYCEITKNAQHIVKSEHLEHTIVLCWIANINNYLLYFVCLLKDNFIIQKDKQIIFLETKLLPTDNKINEKKNVKLK